MKEIAQYTKLSPNDKVKKINDFLLLLTDKKKIKIIQVLMKNPKNMELKYFQLKHLLKRII